MKRDAEFRYAQQPTIRLQRERRDRTLDLGGVANSHSERLDGEGRRSGFECAPKFLGKRGGFRVEEKRNVLDLGRDLLEQGQPFSSDLVFKRGKSGQVAARPCQAGN